MRAAEGSQHFDWQGALQYRCVCQYHASPAPVQSWAGLQHSCCTIVQVCCSTVHRISPSLHAASHMCILDACLSCCDGTAGIPSCSVQSSARQGAWGLTRVIGTKGSPEAMSSCLGSSTSSSSWRSGTSPLPLPGGSSTPLNARSVRCLAHRHDAHSLESLHSAHKASVQAGHQAQKLDR